MNKMDEMGYILRTDSVDLLMDWIQRITTRGVKDNFQISSK